ncbi:unnamed protein product [Calypogeia fissa]
MDGGLVIEREQMQSVLSYSALVDVLNDAFAATSQFSVPDRQSYSIGTPNSGGGGGGDQTLTGTLLIMPAWSNTQSQHHNHHQKTSYIGVKVVTSFPNNVNLGLASVLGLYLLSDGRTGRPLALMNGTELTLWRTACASALAAKYLAKKNPKVLTMIGAGALAPHLIQAHIAVRPSISKVFVWNRTPARAAHLAESLKKSQALEMREIEVCTDLESAIRASDVISCATNSESPLVLGQWLAPGSHLDLIGAYKPTMRECDDEAVRIGCIFIDTPAAISEAGDLCGPIGRNVISPEDVVGDLFALAQGTIEGRRSGDEITLFKSVGCSLEDLAAAQFVYESLSHGRPKL